MKAINAMIEEIGLFVIPHYGASGVEAIIQLETGGTCRISIPRHKVNELVHLFVHDSDYDEDGFYLHSLQGKYVRVVENKERKIVKMGHIFNDRWIELDGEIEEAE